MLSKKYYEPIARIIGSTIGYHEELVNKLCAFFKEDNPRFNTMEFKKRIRDFAKLVQNPVLSLDLPPPFYRMLSGWIGGFKVTLDYSSMAWKYVYFIDIDGEPFNGEHFYVRDADNLNKMLMALAKNDEIAIALFKALSWLSWQTRFERLEDYLNTDEESKMMPCIYEKILYSLYISLCIKGFPEEMFQDVLKLADLLHNEKWIRKLLKARKLWRYKKIARELSRH